MEEYWNMFLNWLGAQQKLQPRMAPPAGERYADSSRMYSDSPFFTNSMKYNNGESIGVIQNTPYTTIPAHITRQIIDNDTIYREKPDQKRFRLRGFPKERTASNRDKNRKEYDILKRRFDTAWGLAK